MITFEFSMSEGDSSTLEKILSHNEYKYPDILTISGMFQIVINEQIFFSEPHFPVFEFIKDALAWTKCSDKHQKMAYSSMETETNPLIVFEKRESKWVISSPWQKYECTVGFTKEELTYAIFHLLETLTKKDLTHH